MKIKFYILIFVLASTTWIYGCSSISILQSGGGVITGKVIDYSTSAPIANAEVILYTGGNVMVTKTIQDNNKDPNLNKTGYFTFRDIPAGDFKLRIVATGYAVVETKDILKYNTYTNGDNTVVKDYNDIPLYKGINLDVYVSSYGTPLNGIIVYSVHNDTVNSCVTYNTNFYSPQITATTDTTGHASIQGLSQCGGYWIVAPATDINGDGIYDYQTGYVGYNSSTNTNTQLAINMLPAQRTNNIAVIALSAQKYQDAFQSNINAVTPQGDIVYVFNYPVSLDGIPQMSYLNSLVINTDPDYNQIVNAPTNATLSAGNTILTIHPTSNLIIENSYYLMGNVSANVQGASQTYPLNSLWYVFDNTANGVGGSNFIISADNFNGSVNGSGGPSTVYLKFPEWVHGTWQVIAAINNGTDVNYGGSGPSGSLTASAMELYEGNGNGGCDGPTCPGTKVVYRVPLTGISINDDASFGGTSTNNVTVAIDATDSEGNRFAGTLTLPIN